MRAAVIFTGRWRDGLQLLLCAIWGFRRDADVNCAILGYYAASSGDSLPMFQELSRNVDSELPLLAA
jgi:hypothetical protein